MRKTCTCIVLLLSSLCLIAQTIRDEVYANPWKMCSNHLTYQLDFKPQTKVPKGYKPFYISHYGRHGSRYHWSADDYQYIYDVFRKADSAGVLTEYGKNSLKPRIDRLYADAYKRAGDLTQTGAAQHKGIATRMVNNYPELFRKNAHIDVKASTSGRCIMSMDAFCQQLKAMRPDIQIRNESSKRLMTYICNDSWDTISYYTSLPAWKHAYDSLFKKYVHTDRIMQTIFSDTNYVQTSVDPIALVRKMYEIHGCMQGIDDLDFSFSDMFTLDELYGNWVVQNAWWYGAYGVCPLTEARGPQFATNLLQHILDQADSAIAGNGISATLRFGHDTGILPLVSLMRLQGCDAEVRNLEDLNTVWCDFKIIPMGANFQMIFYRSSKTSDILVKCMLNENEVTLPLQSDVAPYYHWSDVESLYRKILVDCRN